MRAGVACLTLAAALLSASAADVCKYSFDSVNYDLLSLNTVLSGRDSSGSNYKLDVCKPLGQCGGRGSSQLVAQQLDGTGVCVQGFGLFDDTGGVWSLLNPAQPFEGVRVAYTGVRCIYSPTNQPYTVNVDVGCAKTISAVNVTLPSDPTQCSITFSLSSPAGCGVKKPSKSVFSSGSIFCFVVVVSLVGYVGGGMLYKRLTKGSSGLEAIPHADFWRAFFGNVAHGGSVVYHAVLCRTAPAPEDDVMGYHGVGGDDDDDVIVKQPARRPVESAL